MKAQYQLLAEADGHDGLDTMMMDDDLDLGEFYAINDVDPEEVNAIGALAVGSEYRMGGGAVPVFVVRRVA